MAVGDLAFYYTLYLWLVTEIECGAPFIVSLPSVGPSSSTPYGFSYPVQFAKQDWEGATEIISEACVLRLFTQIKKVTEIDVNCGNFGIE